MKARRAIFGMLNRVAGSRLSGSWKNTPFFDHKTSEPVVTPTVISKANARRSITSPAGAGPPTSFA